MSMSIVSLISWVPIALCAYLATCYAWSLKLTFSDTAPRALSGTCGACTWELVRCGRDALMRPLYELRVCPTRDGGLAQLSDWDDRPPWHSGIDRYIIRVMIASDVKATTCKKMFSGLSHLRTVHLDSLDTSDVKNMSWMFAGCKALKNLDLSGLNTSNVTDMSFMFDGCHAEITLDVTMWRPRGKNAEKMFSDCKPPRLLDVSTGAISVVEWLRRPTSGGE